MKAASKVPSGTDSDNPHDLHYPTAADRGDELLARLARLTEMRLRVGIDTGLSCVTVGVELAGAEVDCVLSPNHAERLGRRLIAAAGHVGHDFGGRQ